MQEADELRALSIGRDSDLVSVNRSSDSAERTWGGNPDQLRGRIVGIALPSVDAVLPISTDLSGSASVDLGGGLEVGVEPAYPVGLSFQVREALAARFRAAPARCVDSREDVAQRSPLIDPADLIGPDDDAASSASPHVRLAALLVSSYSGAIGTGRPRGGEIDTARAAGRYMGMIEAAAALLGEGSTTTELRGQISAAIRTAEARRRAAARGTRGRWRSNLINQLALALALAFAQQASLDAQRCTQQIQPAMASDSTHHGVDNHPA